jgi:hypothetical protein
MRCILGIRTMDGIHIPIFRSKIKVQLANVSGIQSMGQKVRLNFHLPGCRRATPIQLGRRIDL